MEKYNIVESDPETGLHIIKLNTGKYKGLLLSLYNIGCDDSKLFYNFNILNERDNIDDDIESIVKEIVDELYFKEC